MMELGKKLLHLDKDTLEMTINYLSDRVDKIQPDCEHFNISAREKDKMTEMIELCKKNSMSQIGLTHLLDEIFITTEKIKKKIRSIYAEHNNIGPQIQHINVNNNLQVSLIDNQSLEWDK